jgi:putative ABC transport system substrate-binding protein
LVVTPHNADRERPSDPLPALSAAVGGFGIRPTSGGRLDQSVAARILKGTAPADLPVEQSDAWKLTVNLHAAARLGLTIPHSLVGRADEVIE